MKKYLAIFTIFSLFFVGLSVEAKNAKNYAPDSEEAVEDGIYDVQDRPDLKVRVFVHKAPGKPDASATAPICDLTDPGSEAVVGATGWKLPGSVTYRLNVSSVPSSVGGGNLPTVVNNSFGPWQTALGATTPSITRGSNTTLDRARLDYQNIIAWGRTNGSALGVTYIWYYTATGIVADVDTIMNKKFSWTWNGGGTSCANSSTYDAQNIMIHELGHWFGLDDEYDSAYVNNTMYGYGRKGEVKKDTLTNGDIAGINNLY